MEKEATVLKEITNIYPLQVCYACLKQMSVAQRNPKVYNPKDEDYTTISLTRQLTIYNHCPYWNNRKKGDGLRNKDCGWGPVEDCPYHFEHSLTKKKFRITNPLDMEHILVGIGKGECVIIRSEKQYSIRIFGGYTLDDMNEEQLRNLYREMNFKSTFVSDYYTDSERLMRDVIKAVSLERLKSLNILIETKNPWNPNRWAKKKGII